MLSTGPEDFSVLLGRALRLLGGFLGGGVPPPLGGISGKRQKVSFFAENYVPKHPKKGGIFQEKGGIFPYINALLFGVYKNVPGYVKEYI